MIKDFEKGQRIEAFALIKSIEIRKTKNDKDFLNLTLGDKTASINGKLWDVSPIQASMYKVGDSVKIKGSVDEYLGNLQLKLDFIEKATLSENEMENLIESAPFNSLKMRDKILEIIQAMENEDIKKITKTIFSKYEEKILFYPAAKSFHHSMKGGLLYHTYTMLRNASQLVNVYDFLNKDLIFAGVILHDILKVEELVCNDLGVVEDYSKKGKLIGHIVDGAMEISQVGKELNVDEEIITLLEHMLLSHHYHPEFGSPRLPMFPEAELLHYLDILDARMNVMERVFNETKAGEFSGRINALDGRSVYHYNIKE